MSAFSYQAASVPLRLASAGTVVALPVLAVERLDSVAIGGLLTGAALFPAIVVAPLVGTVLDRMRRPRRLLIGAALTTALAFAIAAMLGDVPTGLVALALVIAGLTTPVYMGGMSSFVTSAIAEPRKAYAQDSLSYTMASIAGPAIAALAIALDSARSAMFAMAVLALIGTFGSLGLSMDARPAPEQGVRRTIAAGITHLVRHRPIAVVTISGTLSQVGGGAAGVAAVGLSIERAGDIGAAAWIMTAFAVGGLAGAIAIAVRRWTRRSPAWVMGAGFAATGVLIFAATPDLGILYTIAVIGLAGIFTAPANAAMLLLRDQESPATVKSQVFTIGAGLRSAAAAVGAALAGAVSGLDAGWLIGGIGVVWMLSGLLLVAFPRDQRVPRAERGH
ncbi:putative MFS family arabinose efflux permease [Diaminobutyricimonas aerilata]|uniref:Putative MFS family arabinose efflux permease n=1 Tax=Diaminobutyricimonas aerilata TaxID=1162967 RepID=A0A2M9CG44_9MICO|nr:MFS transporter [Diaminobutyricimonas aerilata]PJJ70883.1 putative MFS family arabinose efflux permease [Diaminobutyricimonas aerilata]